MVGDLPGSIRDVLSAERARLLEVNHNEVILHAPNHISKAAQHLLIYTATAIPLTLRTYIQTEHNNTFCADSPSGKQVCKCVDIVDERNRKNIGLLPLRCMASAR